MKTKAMLMFLAVLLCAGAFVAFSLSRPHPVAPPAVAADYFNPSNYNPMPADTFIRQLQLAYDTAMHVTKEATAISLKWQPADGRTGAFYNNNEALKEVSGHGFELSSDGNILSASFRINNGVVQVPNDVLLGILRALGQKNPPPFNQLNAE